MKGLKQGDRVIVRAGLATWHGTYRYSMYEGLTDPPIAEYPFVEIDGQGVIEVRPSQIEPAPANDCHGVPA